MRPRRRSSDLAALDPRSGANLFAAARRTAAVASLDSAENGDVKRRDRLMGQALDYLRKADDNRAFEDVVRAGRLEFASDFAVLKGDKEFAALVEQDPIAPHGVAAANDVTRRTAAPTLRCGNFQGHAADQ